MARPGLHSGDENLPRHLSDQMHSMHSGEAETIVGAELRNAHTNEVPRSVTLTMNIKAERLIQGLTARDARAFWSASRIPQQRVVSKSLKPIRRFAGTSSARPLQNADPASWQFTNHSGRYNAPLEDRSFAIDVAHNSRPQVGGKNAIDCRDAHRA